MDQRHGGHDARHQELTEANQTLRMQLADVERRHREQLDALEHQQHQELASMRQELAMLRELIAPRVAQEVLQ